MPFEVVRIDETPNPNAIRIAVSPSPGANPRSYRSADAAADDPLGAALFAVHGVTNVLIHDGWISVSKAPGAPWKAVRAGVEAALREAASP